MPLHKHEPSAPRHAGMQRSARWPHALQTPASPHALPVNQVFSRKKEGQAPSRPALPPHEGIAQGLGQPGSPSGVGGREMAPESNFHPQAGPDPLSAGPWAPFQTCRCSQIPGVLDKNTAPPSVAGTAGWGPRAQCFPSQAGLGSSMSEESELLSSSGSQRPSAASAHLVISLSPFIRHHCHTRMVSHPQQCPTRQGWAPLQDVPAQPKAGPQSHTP